MAMIRAQHVAEILVNIAKNAVADWRGSEGEIEPLVAVTVLVPMSVAAVLRDDPRATAVGVLPEQFCRMCGCTNDNACEPPCHWVEPDLCSSCVPKTALLIPAKVVPA
jgi:hypothetical protein